MNRGVCIHPISSQTENTERNENYSEFRIDIMKPIYIYVIDVQNINDIHNKIRATGNEIKYRL